MNFVRLCIFFILLSNCVFAQKITFIYFTLESSNTIIKCEANALFSDSEPYITDSIIMSMQKTEYKTVVLLDSIIVPTKYFLEKITYPSKNHCHLYKNFIKNREKINIIFDLEYGNFMSVHYEIKDVFLHEIKIAEDVMQIINSILLLYETNNFE
ncbi:MAG: hypothetical protein LBV69_02250 [Bacteroidales bacterium]|jgi:hypothetical protein|nr:hypothetical protein [Bacteroidales bacterium]